MKHAVIEHPALTKYWEMKRSFETDALVRFAVRDSYAPNEIAARDSLDGALQWLACHAVKEHAEQPYVMMNGPVDEMYHALMLNTRLYLHFCREYIGFFIHHTPVDDAQADEIRIAGGIDYTLSFLQDAFGVDLSPTLHNWVAAHQSGELGVSSVSCMGNDFDSAPDHLLGVTDFRTFWDRNQQTVGTA